MVLLGGFGDLFGLPFVLFCIHVFHDPFQYLLATGYNHFASALLCAVFALLVAWVEALAWRWIARRRTRASL